MTRATLAGLGFSWLGGCILPGSETGDTTAETGADTGTGASPDATIVYALRHAEKDEDADDGDPGLTEEGTERALALADLMHEVPLVAIYATELRRTQDTVAPTAADHGLTVLTDIDPEADLAAYILLVDAGESVLACGHSYTVPGFIEALGIDDPPSADDYGDLWIITVEADGTASLEASRYGDDEE